MYTRTLYVAALAVFLTSCGSSRKPVTGTEIIISSENKQPVHHTAGSNAAPPATATVVYSDLQNKYARYLGVSPQAITNIKLYQFIDEWLHTPYKWGGMDKRGIDCSAFVQKLFDNVYNIYVPRTSAEQFFANWIDRFASDINLAEGDLIFFTTIKGKLISHVGLYLGNRIFINCSNTSKGVGFGSLDNSYWKRTYVAAGRIKQSMISNVR